MRGREYSASPGAVRELLQGGGEFVAPEKLLSDLTEAQANQQVSGSPYTIAQIVAHLHYWQGATLAHLNGADRERPAHLDDTFASPPSGGWGQLVVDFLGGIAVAAALATEKASATSPDRDDTNVGYDLAESALHNAYHLGQVVLLRQMLGFWPPAGGDDNDF